MINIVFDMDGVIFDTETLCRQAWRMAGEEQQIPAPEIDRLLKLCIGSNQQHMTEVLKKELGADFPVQRFLLETKEQVQTLADSHLPLKKGAREILEWLHSQGATVGLASSTERRIIEKYLRISGLADDFQAIVGGDQVTHSKPHGEIYRKACAALGVDPEETYGIEDSYNGVRSASNAGLRTIMVPDLLPATQEMRELAETIEEDLFAVKAYIRFGQEQK